MRSATRTKPARQPKSRILRRAAVTPSFVIERHSSYCTATEAKNEFGRFLEQAVHGEPVVITKHDAPRAVLMSFDQFTALKQAPEAKLNVLRGEFDQMLARMQTPKARRAAERLFRLTPVQLGKAAVAGARKRG